MAIIDISKRDLLIAIGVGIALSFAIVAFGSTSVYVQDTHAPETHPQQTPIDIGELKHELSDREAESNAVITSISMFLIVIGIIILLVAGTIAIMGLG